MDVLAGRKTGGVITGDIRVNGGWRRLQTSMDRLAHRQCAKLHTNGNVRKLAEGQFYLYAHCCLAPTAALRAGHPKVHQTFARVMGYCEQTGGHGLGALSPDARCAARQLRCATSLVHCLLPSFYN